jgi:hypothetical protein
MPKHVAPRHRLAKLSIDLLHPYVPIDETTPTEAAPYFVASGLRKMYLQAQVHETEGESNFILRRLLAEPDTPFWANCGSSADLMVFMLSTLDVPARTISLWHTMTDSHVALEFYSAQFNKYVFYDPLYGAFLIDEWGRPASVQDILNEVRVRGRDSNNWAYQPVRIYDLFSNQYAPAANSEYESYNSLDYHFIMDNYVRIVAIRDFDFAPFQYYGLGTVPGSNLIRGSWDVYHDMDLAEWTATREDFMDQYDESRGGRYTLNFID